MIEYCLESAECDPDVEIKSTDELNKSNEEQNNDEDESEDDDGDEDEKENENENESENENENENPQPMDDTNAIDNENSDLKLKETSIFSLLRTVTFIDPTTKHPL